MKLRKGYKLKDTKGNLETIVKASNNRLTGDVITDKETYSTDFIMRQLDFGFLTLEK